MRPEDTGKKSERQIKTVLDSHGYEEIHWKQIMTLLRNKSLYEDGKKYYCKNFPLGVCLYPILKRREEFFLLNSPKYPSGLFITVKWQQSTGSTYEKAPYVVENVKKYHPYPTIVIWDGAWSLAGVRGGFEWLKQQIGGKLIEVFTKTEFEIWANKGGL